MWTKRIRCVLEWMQIWTKMLSNKASTLTLQFLRCEFLPSLAISVFYEIVKYVLYHSHNAREMAGKKRHVYWILYEPNQEYT